jgi:hypothetical protein
MRVSNTSTFVTKLKVFSVALLVSGCASTSGPYDIDQNKGYNVLKQAEGYVRYEHMNDKDIRLEIEDHAITHCKLINKTASRGKTNCVGDSCTTTYLCQEVNLLNRD